MQTLTGKSVCRGISFGRLYFYHRAKRTVQHCHITDTEAEIRRFHAARKKAVSELAALFQTAQKSVGESEAMIFYIHQMMLEDIDFIASTERAIREEHLNAESAVEKVASGFQDMFDAMEDSYIRERSADVLDVSERVISILSNRNSSRVEPDQPAIIVADDLAPSETVLLDRSKILAFITEKGASTSHTAILARTMNIPALIGASGILRHEYDGKEAIVDGYSGMIYIDPDEETYKKMRQKKQTYEEERKNLECLRGQKTVTADGQEIMLYANINSETDAEAALLNDAEGIGLFRSEYLFLDREDYPDEETQFRAFRAVLEKMGDRRVIVRSFDIGADKNIGYFHLDKEENPALGIRAIRLCLKRPELFKTHLRALYRASAFGRLAIMLPMIISPEEIRQTKELIAGVQEELRNEGKAFSKHVELGIMIETPAAVMISDLLAKEADFFSIGTNDLTQYLLALDRQNDHVADSYNPFHPALIRSIQTVIRSAHQAGIWVGVCGEIGSDPEFAEILLSLGIDEISVPPNMILPLRKKINSYHKQQLSL